MRRYMQILAGILACLAAAGCSAQSPAGGPAETTAVQSEALQSTAAETEEAAQMTAAGTTETKRVARDDAVMQTLDPNMPTRVIEGGTPILLHFGDTVLPGVLNDSDTAKALIEMLPYTVHMNSYSHDFCGVMPDELTYNEDEVHYGWLNGDIDYAIDAPYFTILHSDEDDSEQYGYQVNIGVLDCSLDQIRDLTGSYDVVIELAEEA